MHYIIDNDTENMILNFWKYRLSVSVIGPYMADISVLTLKKLYLSIS